MSYMRGKYYIWTSGGDKSEDTNVHFWVGSDKDRILESGWAEMLKEDEVMGCSLPGNIFDELVVMRYNELIEEGIVEEVEKRTAKKFNGNGGCDVLAKKYGFPTMIEKATKHGEELKKAKKKK